jgi:ABC-type multidrug transport system fused ATPase/permease subunit
VGDFWCAYLFMYCQQKIIRQLRVDLLAAILRQEVGFFDVRETGELNSRLTADTGEMANDLTWVFRFTIEALIRIGGIVGYMFLAEWRLALVT